MATTNGVSQDPLILLRRSISAGTLPIPALESNASTAAGTTPSLAQANYLIFNHTSSQHGSQHIAIPLTQQTRFVSPAAGAKALDLRSVYWCWLNKDQGASEYISRTTALNQELKSTAGKDEVVTNLVFAEKLDLNQCLSGDIPEGESEFIQPLDGTKATKAEAADAAKMAAGEEDVEMADAADGDASKREAERLREIYAAERKMGDRNTVLRGVKVQDFGDVRKKYSILFFGRSKDPKPHATNPSTINPALRPPGKAVQPARRPEPIILLSPSASSLLRMSNIKSFLSDGIYVPPESGSSANILHLTRTLSSVSSSKPVRFILVDDPGSFRPDYWERLVAVFTTGQTWQFKQYKWQQPAELFSHALGIYVGWKGEVIPDTVKGWGRGVTVAQIDKGGQRWRDREVVEDVWRGIEGRMKEMGWGKDQH